MNKIISRLLLTALLIQGPLAFMAWADSASPNVVPAFRGKHPQTAGGDATGNFAPPITAHTGLWTTCVLAHSGKALVKGINSYGTSADVAATLGYFVVYDSNTISGLTSSTVDTSKLIFIGRPDTQKLSPGWEFEAGLSAQNGVVVCNGTATMHTSVRVYPQ